MTAIIATTPVPSASRPDLAETETFDRVIDMPPCPAWCGRHYTDEDDGATMHTSEPVITRANVDRETHEIGVELYRLDLPAALAAEAGLEVGGDGKASIHIEGAGQADMTPEQALSLATVLIEHARLVLGNQVYDNENTATALGFEYGRRYERIVIEQRAEQREREARRILADYDRRQVEGA